MKTLGSGVASVCAILLLGAPRAPAQEVAPPIPTHPDARLAAAAAAAAPAAEPDPFAWLRRPGSPEATRWAAQEAEQAQRWLNADSSYPPLLRQAGALAGGDGSVLLAGGRLYLEGPAGEWTSRSVRTEPAAAGWRREAALDPASPAAASDGVEVLCAPSDRGACLRLRRTGASAELSGYDPASGALQPSSFAAGPGLQDAAIEAGGGLLAVSVEAGAPVVRRLAPGAPDAAAVPVYRGAAGEVVTPGAGVGRGGEPVAWLTVRRADGAATLLIDAQGAFRRLAAPAGSEIVGVVGDQLVVQLRQGWKGVDSLPAGSLLGFDLKPLLARAPELSPHPILKLADTPDIRQAVATRAGLIVVAREGREEVAYLCDPTLRGWAVRRLSATAADDLEVAAVDPAGDAAVLRSRAFPEGDRLRAVDTRDGAVTPELPRREAFAGRPRRALTASALDRSQVGYTLIQGSAPDGADAARPVLLMAAPRGSSETQVLRGIGALWLARGGDLAVAGRRARRYDPGDGLAEVLTGYEDLSSIARDLVARGLAREGRISLAGDRSGASLAAVDLVKHPGQWAAAALIDPVADPLGASADAEEPWAQTFASAREGPRSSAWRRVAPYDNLRQGVRYAPLLTVRTPQASEVFASDGARLTARLNAVGGDSLHVPAQGDAQACALAVAFLTRVLGLGAKT